ncbi:SMI1/KNR4 family protein [Xanthocytophaga agilis]|uniref:SMI1/KNR4 family protein n=1 Tax=Xanthocytophaga agilis TaxID=3048010 RepID=A0AAE3R9N7_9BACT|nr:SMI1/KNR4 family protein [Xanthocytophaga agilis]MDJ1504039.1 SMI1/KNR4 family protein [Xanthocytophaga agilis]
MKEEDFQLIEENLQIKLPTFYRDFQLNYPEDLRILAVMDLKNTEDFPPLSYSSKWVIETNNTLWWDREGWLIIGENGNIIYFIKLDGEDESVYSWDPDDERFYGIDDSDYIPLHEAVSKKASSMNEFVDILIEEIVGPYPDHFY